MKHTLIITLTLSATLAAMAVPVAAQTRGTRYQGLAPAHATASRRAGAGGYYPYEVKGGVSGDLPFNNQLRKLSAPLSANGK